MERGYGKLKEVSCRSGVRILLLCMIAGLCFRFFFLICWYPVHLANGCSEMFSEAPFFVSYGLPCTAESSYTSALTVTHHCPALISRTHPRRPYPC